MQDLPAQIRFGEIARSDGRRVRHRDADGFAVIIGVTGADATCNVTTELVALP